jgi:hypothetical protein
MNRNRAAYIPGLLEAYELDDLLGITALRAFFPAAGEHDRLFPVDGVLDIVEKAKDFYVRVVPERFEAVLHSGLHGFPGDLKDKAYAFLDRYLKS